MTSNVSTITEAELDALFETEVRAFEGKFRLVKTLKEHGWSRVHGSRFGDRPSVTAFVNPNASTAREKFWRSMNAMTSGCDWLVWVVRPSIWQIRDSAAAGSPSWAVQAKFYTGAGNGPDGPAP